MKRFVLALSAAVALWGASGSAHASGCCGLKYSGWQPWWNVCNRYSRRLPCEEQRLQKFWHDYYDAMKKYYGLLDHLDWVAYYKNHGYPLNGGGAGPCGPGGPCGAPCNNINYAPVFVNPQMQWAMPNGCMGGGPAAPCGGGGMCPGGYPQ